MAPGDSSFKSIAVPSNVCEAEQLCRGLLLEAERNNFGADDVFAIHLAVGEALSNAIRHGNKLDPARHVYVDYSVSAEKFEIFIRDDGNGFRPDKLPDPRNVENLLKSGGRGVLLIHSYMDTVEYNDSGNCIHMVKFRSPTGRQKQAN